MGATWKLRKMEDQLIEDLKKTTIPFMRLAKKYGVSRQAIFYFCHSRKIRRPKKPMGEHTEICPICQALIQIAKKPYGDFISSPTIQKRLNIGSFKFNYHTNILRSKGLLSRKFGKLRSKKVERAYQIYFEKRPPVGAIGRQVGLKYFYSAIRKHRILGWDIPAPIWAQSSNEGALKTQNRVGQDSSSVFSQAINTENDYPVEMVS